MSNSWWNTNYPIKRNLKITPQNNQPILAGHPIFCFFDKDQLLTLNKIRENFEDLEVIFSYGSTATPTFMRLAREVTYDSNSDIISIVFNAVNQIETENTSYSLYMANNTLTGFTLRPDYSSSLYIISVTPQDPLGIMFSKPGEDWVNGVSSLRGARATLGFLGINVRITLEKGPDKGILEIKLDDDSTFIDCYSPTTQNEIVFESNNLSKQKHYLRMIVNGNKSPNSSGNTIKIVSIEYSKFIEAIDQGEDFYSLTGPINAIVGL